jgi:hypothetical protein
MDARDLQVLKAEAGQAYLGTEESYMPTRIWSKMAEFLLKYTKD